MNTPNTELTLSEVVKDRLDRTPTLTDRGELDGECLVWTGALFSTGYGAVSVGGRVKKVHRVAWEQANGEIPAGTLVLHSCDNRACFRLEHLRLGTHKDNTADMDARGRRGSDGRAKLTLEDVRDIRRRFSLGETQIAIAERFHVTNVAVHMVVRRKTWRHVA